MLKEWLSPFFKDMELLVGVDHFVHSHTTRRVEMDDDRGRKRERKSKE